MDKESTSLDCRRTETVLPWLVNGTLTPDERSEVLEHLLGCPACREQRRQTEFAFELTRPAAEPAVVPDLTTARAATKSRRQLIAATLVAAAGGGVIVAMLGIGRGAGEVTTSAASVPEPQQEIAVVVDEGRISSNGFEDGTATGWN